MLSQPGSNPEVTQDPVGGLASFRDGGDHQIGSAHRVAASEHFGVVGLVGERAVLGGEDPPAIVGVEVMKGIVKSDNRLLKEGKKVGEVKELQNQGENVSEAKAGEKVAVSIDGCIVGRNINEGDELDVRLGEHDISVLKKLRHRLRGDELELLDELEGK